MIVHNAYFCGPAAKRTEKLELREKKRQSTQQIANEKAMRTLKIKPGRADDVTEADIAEQQSSAASSSVAAYASAVPSVTNLYREVMAQAGKTPVSMYDRINKARAKNPYADHPVRAITCLLSATRCCCGPVSSDLNT